MDAKMLCRVDIPRNALAAMLCLAGKRDPRYYINGLKIEVTPTCGRLVATNGAVLGVFEWQHAENDPPFISGGHYFEAILDRDHIERLPKARRSDPALIPAVFTDGRGDDNGKDAPPLCSLDIGAGQPAINGRFPDYHSLFPVELGEDTRPAQIRADLLAAFAKCKTILTGSKVPPGILHRGPSCAALVSFGDMHRARFAGIFVPYLLDAPDFAALKWAADCLSPSSAEPQQAAA